MSESVIYLWAMQFLFAVTPWLVLAMGIAAVAIVFHKFDAIAEKRQKEPIDSGIKGLPRIALNQAVFNVMIFVLRNLTGIAIFLGASTTYMIAYMIRNRVELETEKLPDEFLASGVDWSTGFMVICGLIGITITITIAIETYYALRRRGKLLLQASDKPESAPLIARLYGLKTRAGIIIIVVACYPLLMLIMNLIWGFALLMPLPAGLLTIELPAGNILLLVMFGVLWVGVVYTMASPTITILLRQFLISLRQYEENRFVHVASKSIVALMLGLFGGLLTIAILYYIGEALFPTMF